MTPPDPIDPFQLEGWMLDPTETLVRVVQCPYCGVDFLQRGDATEDLPGFYPSYCHQPACKATDAMLREVQTEYWRRTAPIEDLERMVTSRVRRFVKDVQNKAPEVIVDQSRTMVRKAVEILLRRTSENRGTEAPSRFTSDDTPT